MIQQREVKMMSTESRETSAPERKYMVEMVDLGSEDPEEVGAERDDPEEATETQVLQSVPAHVRNKIDPQGKSFSVTHRRAKEAMNDWNEGLMQAWNQEHSESMDDFKANLLFLKSMYEEGTITLAGNGALMVKEILAKKLDDHLARTHGGERLKEPQQTVNECMAQCVRNQSQRARDAPPGRLTRGQAVALGYK